MYANELTAQYKTFEEVEKLMNHMVNKLDTYYEKKYLKLNPTEIQKHATSIFEAVKPNVSLG